MIAESIRKRALLNWRLCLQTSGIYRDSAIPGCKVKVKTAKSKSKPAGRRLTPPPALVWPRTSALRLHPCRALSSAPVTLSLERNDQFVEFVIVVGREK